MTLDAMALGSFVHGVLEITVNALESESGLSTATPSQIEAAVAKAIREVAESWETEQPVPPAIVWRHAQETAKDLALKALGYPFTPLPKQTTWTEVPFGAGSALKTDRCNLPWTPNQKVEILGSGLHIRGRIDRLDISGDETVARVIDYKTGRLNNKQSEVVIDGGSELQRCLYAFAVKTLVNPKIKVEAALLFPRAADGNESLFPLANVNTVTKDLARFIRLARINLEDGLALPGIDAGGKYNDLVFALPANAKASYLARKQLLVSNRLGEFVQLWERP